jgi:phosphoribosylglycinamide formyltransferase-1
MHRLAFFISGTGGNAMNLLKACREGRVPGEPVLGIASSAKAGGVERLRGQGLEVAVIERSAYSDNVTYSEACFQRAEQAGVEVIALCGWLKKLVIPARWEGRVLNIHPGPLPRFGGAGMYGMKVHQAVVEAGVAESAVTIHLVDNEYDHGSHLAVQPVPVLPGDTPETLQKRVYEQEMRLYPEALAAFLKGLQ